jgi:hypothetical protein
MVSPGATSTAPASLRRVLSFFDFEGAEAV